VGIQRTHPVARNLENELTFIHMKTRREMAAKGKQSVTKQERVYAAVRERILNGAYGPGYRVVIDSLATEFEVSALPVREAIRRLEAEGLIVYRPNAGAQVAPSEPGEYDDELTVLAVLEGYATAIARDSFGPKEIKKLKEINVNMVDAMHSLDSLRFGALNQEFHAVMYSVCPNPTLVDLARDVSRRLDAIRRTVFVQIPYRGAASVSEHEHLIELIESKAPHSEIELAARNHKLKTVASFQEWREKQKSGNGHS
jgi:DNA-binding GntR family transcriptional regulator